MEIMDVIYLTYVKQNQNLEYEKNRKTTFQKKLQKNGKKLDDNVVLWRTTNMCKRWTNCTKDGPAAQNKCCIHDAS